MNFKIRIFCFYCFHKLFHCSKSLARIDHMFCLFNALCQCKALFCKINRHACVKKNCGAFTALLTTENAASNLSIYRSIATFKLSLISIFETIFFRIEFVACDENSAT